MCKVVVIMSAYNGERSILRQINSILNQKGVAKICCYIRDDGSTDKTYDLVCNHFPNSDSVIIQRGSNIGWEKSFMMALKEAPSADYYAFSDQDDIWMENKVKAGIDFLKLSDNKKPLLYHCNKFSVNENLKPLSHQVRRTPRPLNHQNAMVQEYAQGCSIIINNKARDLVTSYLPKKKIAHDFWCGLICYLFGEIIYDEGKHFYHISYGNNASGEGHMLNSWLGRLKKLVYDEEAYYSPWQDLLEGYENILSENDRRFCQRLMNYKHSMREKLHLLLSPKFIRDSFFGTISLKTAVLLNKL